jgi:hypothetical protein
MTPDEVDVPAELGVVRRRPWVTPLLAGAMTFAVTALSVRSAARRQGPILDSMEMQPVAAAASLAYAWGSLDDAVRLEREVLALAERRSSEEPTPPSPGEPDFVALRRMDADLAKLRLATLTGAPHAEFARLCAAASIRCTPYTLSGLMTMLKKQRHVEPPAR